MTLAQLRHFQAVCHHKSVTRAAQALHITQPSVSSSIRELETELGINLFHRLNKRLLLTQEGEFFLEKTTEILSQVDTLTQHMQEIGNQRSLVGVGVPPMIGTFLFPALFDAFHKAHPHTQVQIVEQGSLRTKQLVLEEKLDVAIAIAEEGKDPDLNRLRLLTTSLQFCVSPSHPLANSKEVSLQQLAPEPLIFFKDDSYQSQLLADRFARLGILPSILLSSSQLYTIKKMISQGRAGAFLFKEIAEMEQDIVGIPLSDPILMDICLIWKKSRHVYSHTAALIQFVRNNPGTFLLGR